MDRKKRAKRPVP